MKLKMSTIKMQFLDLAATSILTLTSIKKEQLPLLM